ncbi:hypothetical protein GWE18_15315 [Bradyrhizobium sp. CSA112]|uniref:hypothetical protein n=1 Tax=Bradyrhizobium sp. CSA112 TaxID=2699170 RepID=UPI0023B0503D|nr:hypothetical protein [Bradyrhizobium sp. CSA112]MDE5454190.1 hypothetical protein [Bradyrhizobium sp. CSA112]
MAGSSPDSTIVFSAKLPECPGMMGACSRRRVRARNGSEPNAEHLPLVQRRFVVGDLIEPGVDLR